jgi:hypothetical protein
VGGNSSAACNVLTLGDTCAAYLCVYVAVTFDQKLPCISPTATLQQPHERCEPRGILQAAQQGAPRTSVRLHSRLALCEVAKYHCCTCCSSLCELCRGGIASLLAGALALLQQVCGTLWCTALAGQSDAHTYGTLLVKLSSGLLTCCCSCSGAACSSSSTTGMHV